MEILQHVSVRWLSLETCVTRILRLYEPLASYFKSTGKTNVQICGLICSLEINNICVSCTVSLFSLTFKKRINQDWRGYGEPFQIPWLKCTSSSTRPPYQSSPLWISSSREKVHLYFYCKMRYILKGWKPVFCLSGCTNVIFGWDNSFLNIYFRWLNSSASSALSSSCPQFYSPITSLRPSQMWIRKNHLPGNCYLKYHNIKNVY